MSCISNEVARVAALAVAVMLATASVGGTDLLGLTFFGGELVDVDPVTGLCGNARPLRYNNQAVRYAVGITQHPASGVLYMLTTYSSLLGAYVYTVDPTTGDLTPVTWPTGVQVFEGDVDFDPTTGTLYALQDSGPGGDETNLFSIDLSSGATTIIADLQPALGTDRDYSAMAFTDDGRLYLLNTDLDEIIRVDPTTGAVLSSLPLTLPGFPSPDLGNCAAMDFEPVTGQLYLADGCDAGNDALYIVDLATGVMTEMGPTSLTSGLCGMRFFRSSLLFADDFEDGTTGAWSSTVP